PNRAGHLLLADLGDHTAGGRGVAGGVGRAALERTARTGAAEGVALAVNPRALAATDHRVRDLLLAHLRLTLGYRVGHLLDGRHRHHLADGVGHLLDDGVRHLLANRVGDHLGHGLLAVGGAGHLLAHGTPVSDLACAHLGRALNAAALPVAALMLAATGARIEAAGVARALPVVLALARHAILLAAAFLDLARDRLAGRDRHADRFLAALVARLDTILVASLAAFLVAGLVARLAGGAADFLHAMHAHRLA